MDWFLYDNGPRHERVKRVALDYFSGKNLNVYCTRFGQPSSADFELNFEKKKKSLICGCSGISNCKFLANIFWNFFLNPIFKGS